MWIAQRLQHDDITSRHELKLNRTAYSQQTQTVIAFLYKQFDVDHKLRAGVSVYRLDLFLWRASDFERTGRWEPEIETSEAAARRLERG